MWQTPHPSRLRRATFSRRRRLLEVIPNVFADTWEIAHDIQVGVTENLNTQRGKVCITNSILLFSVVLLMLRSVQFDNKLFLRNIKVHNIISNNLLPVYHDW